MKICYLYPDLLNVNGSRGNVVCLAQRARERGEEVTVTNVPAGGSFNASDFDVIYLGAGHGEPGEVLLAEAMRVGGQLRQYANDGGVILAVCEGFELLAKTLALSDGSIHEGMGVINMTVAYGAARRTGDYSFNCGGDIGEVVAFRNHAGKITLGEGLSPLGLTPDGQSEGVRYKNVFGSYGHGPLLPRNPRLADAILSIACGRELAKLSDALETTAHDYMTARLK